MRPSSSIHPDLPTDVDTLLDRLSDIGVAHAVVHRDRSPSIEWVAFEHLLDDLPRRVEALGRHLGGPRPAVAASMVGRALVPLVVIPTATAWSLWRTAPDLGASNLLVGVDGCGAVVAVAMCERSVVGASPDHLAGWFADEIIDGVCGRLIQGLRHTAPLGSRHLWGNVALAVAAPFASLLATGRHDGRADRDILLRSRQGLADLVEIIDVSTEGRVLEAVRRRTCCLLAKVPDPHGGLCGTCSLHPRTEHVERLGAYYRGLAVS